MLAKFKQKLVAALLVEVGTTVTINSQSVVPLARDSSGNVLRATGTVVITDGGAGYAKNCLYIKTNATTSNSGLYTNNGTTSSCAFVLVGTIGSASVGVTQLATDALGEVTVSLTAAQIKAIHTTPITAVAAPGAGKYISVDEIRWNMTYGSIAFTGSNNLEFRYTDGSGAKVSADLAAATLNAAANAIRSIKPVTTELTPVLNAAVVIVAPVADPGAGNSTATVTIRYHVVTA